MKIPSILRRKWELNFPDLSGKWTHWKIFGENFLIGVVSGDELIKGLDLVQSNFTRFDSIKACRVIANEEREIVEEEKSDFAIAHQVYDKRKFKLK